MTAGVENNIASHLVEMARRQPNTPALYVSKRKQWVPTSFAALNEQSDRLAAGFQAAGIAAGMRTALCVRPGVDFFAITFALFKIGAVPVLIDPGIGLRNFGRCLAQAKPEAFIGIPLVHALRRTLGWAKHSSRINITTGTFGGISLEKLANSSASPNPIAINQIASEAAILFTSGSTGPAKGVVYTHDNFQAQIDALKATYGIEPGEIDLATFPLFGLFGPALGMTTVVPVMNFTRPGFVDPRNIVGPIQELKITNMFGSPALIERVSRHGEAHGVKLPTLKRVISAGAPASAPTLARFSKMLSGNAQIFTPYGATEALPVSSIGSAEILGETSALTDAGHGVCVGKPVGNMRVRIIRITEDAVQSWVDAEELPANAVGEIVVQGPVVTRKYFELPEATRLSKIADSATGEFYHRMGDAGYFDDAGRLWFCGRKSQRVKLAGGDIFSTPFEGVFNTHLAVAKSALVDVQRNGETIPVICVELSAEGKTRSKSAVRQELLALAQQHDHTQIIHHILFHARFPVDIRHNAKINREQLAAWAERKLP